MHIVTFSALADFPGLLEAHLHAFSDSATGEPVAAPSDIVRDNLTYETSLFHGALSQMLDGENPVIRWDAENPAPETSPDAGDGDDPDDSLISFQTARKRTLSILEGLSDTQWMRTGKLDGTEITVIGLVHLLCAHDWEQLAVLQRRLAACSAV